MKLSSKLGLTAGLLALSVQAMATPVTVQTIIADFNNHTGGDHVTYTDADGNGGHESISWGASTGNASGYTFEASAPPIFNVETDTEFSLGTFTHLNYPIFDDAITGVDFNITMDLMIGGTSVGEGPFTFNFAHDETPNDCIAANCSNDHVTFSNLVTSDTFMIGNAEYTLELLGFRYNGMFAESFSTIEGERNDAELVGIFRAPTTTVPEPGTLLLLTIGLIGAGVTRKRAR